MATDSSRIGFILKLKKRTKALIIGNNPPQAGHLLGEGPQKSHHTRIDLESYLAIPTYIRQGKTLEL